MDQDLVTTLADLKEAEALEIVRARLDAGEDPLGILNDTRHALAVVGERYAAQEYFIPDLVYSGEISKVITEMVKPRLAEAEESSHLGRIVIGTVAGDIHDIGKNIVTFMLEVSGFEVHDLGVDVPPQRFVGEIEAFRPQILGLSGFLTLAYDSMRDTIRVIQDAGLRDTVKIMIGGGVLDETVVAYVAADGFERHASGAASLAKKWIGG